MLLDDLLPEKKDRVDIPLPLVQKRQADMLEACGFVCASVGEREFGGEMVEMWQPTGEWEQAKTSRIGYGGAAFGGKTYGMLVLIRVLAELIPGITISFFRRTYSELLGPNAAIQLSYEVFGQVARDRDGGKEWHWENGSSLYFRHAQHLKDVHKYQSQSFEVLLIDEATSFEWQIADYLLTRNRVAKDLPNKFRPFALLTTNPGNVGHAWYAKLFDLAVNKGDEKKHEQVKRVVNPNGKNVDVYFIPAFLEDNAIGVARDPEYEDRLMESDPEVARALRYGDWTVFAGQMFPSWTRDRVACEAFDIPVHWAKWRACDYGYTHDWSAGWFTMDPDTKRVYVYRAINQSGLTDRQQARTMKSMTPPSESIVTTYAGHDYWSKSAKGEKVTTSVDEYKAEGIHLDKADIDRINGVKKIQRLLVDMPDGKSGIQVFEDYYSEFNCMVSVIRDPNRPEDVKKVDGDDAFDMLKYGLTNTNPKPRMPKSKKKRNQSASAAFG